MAGTILPETVKKPKQRQDITKEQVTEYIKCNQDPVYFIETYVRITSIDVGEIPFDMYDYQKDMVNNYSKNRFNINLLSRQSGKTSAVASFALHHVLFEDRKNVLILANKFETAKEILDRIKKMYELLPMWLQQGVLSWGASSIELENYSKIRVSTTTPDSGRSGSISLLILDEFAFVRNSIAEQFWTAVYPVISSGKESRVIIISTANGLNLFYKMWVDAVEGSSDFQPYEVSWEKVPGRDDKWRTQTISNMGGDEERFDQEFENVFTGSSNTMIPISKLKTLAYRKPIQHSDGQYNVYEEPLPMQQYFMGVDVARGIGGDYTVIQVLDITEYPYRQVAIFRNNTIEVMAIPTIIKEWGERYNDAYVLLEGNDMGEGVATTLQNEIEYENVLSTSFQGMQGQRLGSGFGKSIRSAVFMSKKIKMVACNSLKSLIMNDRLIIQDFTTVQELSTFVRKGQTWVADEGSHEDPVMSLVVFAWACQEPYFKDLTDHNLRVEVENSMMGDVLESAVPFGFIDDGRGQDDGWETVEVFQSQ